MPQATTSRSRSRRGVQETSRPELRPFLLHLASERGLAENTLHAYRRDLENLSDHLDRRGKSLRDADADDYTGYVQSQRKSGRSTKTISRRIAAIRVYLRFLAGEGKDVT